MLDIGIGRYDNTSYFLPVHGILRLNVIRIATGFHFHNNQFLIFVGYNIQLKVILPPVTVTYGVTVLFKYLAAASSPAFPRILCALIILRVWQASAYRRVQDGR